MGLDIRAYSKLTKDEELTKKAKIKNFEIDTGDCFLVMRPDNKYIDEVFPNRATPLEYNGDVYACEESVLYFIGSYGTYNYFRNELEQFSNKHLQHNAFDMLINFPDCEGIFGSVTCELLYKNFKAYEKDFKIWTESRYKYDVLMADLIMCIYLQFESAFLIGMDGGAVEFC